MMSTFQSIHHGVLSTLRTTAILACVANLTACGRDDEDKQKAKASTANAIVSDKENNQEAQVQDEPKQPEQQRPTQEKPEEQPKTESTVSDKPEPELEDLDTPEPSLTELITLLATLLGKGQPATTVNVLEQFLGSNAIPQLISLFTSGGLDGRLESNKLVQLACILFHCPSENKTLPTENK